MSEEVENDSSWSSLKKTIVGAIATAITAGGAYLTSTLLGGGDDKSEAKTEQTAPAPVINLNVDNSSKNTSTSSGGGGTTTIIKEKTVEKQPAAAPTPAKPKSESEDAPW